MAGCVEDEEHQLLAPPGTPASPTTLQPVTPAPSAPAHLLQPLPTHLPSLTSSRSGRLRRRAPQQPRKPSRDRAMPTASSSHAPALSTALAATMSWKPAGSTATQTPTPTRHVPPACRGRSGDDHGVRGCPRLGPLSGMGVTHPSQTEMSPHVDGGCLNPWSPPWGRCHPPLSQLEMLLPRHRFPPPLYPTGPRWTHEHQHVEDEHQVLHAAQDAHGDTGRGDTAVFVPMEGRAEPWPQPALACPGPHSPSRMWGDAASQNSQIILYPHHLP